ncbi:hypothetical protein QFC22_003060 [Naganishia vaughanmartiniae]|uniref:Uncharacterized protein n=1 Tax=Naganishia vaughanmartiniae TaxID=1424756 RepID=A0ACC2XAR3_9TREE|nr:hypothetical protein QFC22_003060 [Naganishia vaughanmartiniae]
MRYRLTGQLSAYNAGGGIFETYPPYLPILQGFQKQNVIQPTLLGRYSTGAHPNTRPSRRSGTASSVTRTFPKTRDARSTSAKNENWLEFDLNDDSIPEQVRSSAWRIKVLDIANVVSHADAERLHKALRDFHKARGKPDRQKKDPSHGDIAARLVTTFGEVQLQAEEKFHVEAQRDVGQLTTEEANLRRDVALALDQLRNLQDVPQDAPNPDEQKLLGTSEPVKVDESLETIKVKDMAEDIGEIQPDAAVATQEVRLKRFQSESTLAWIQRKRLQYAIDWADQNAQSKLRRFQFYLSGESPHASASDVESAKAEYAKALERQRLLSLELGSEDGVIIRHRPLRPPPVVLPPSAPPIPQTARSGQMDVVASADTLPQEEHSLASEYQADLPTPEALPNVPMPEPIPHTIAAVEPSKREPLRTGLFATVQRAVMRVAAAFTNPWKTVVQLVKGKPKIAANVVQTFVADGDAAQDAQEPNPTDDLDAPTTLKRSTAEKKVTSSTKPKTESSFLKFMKSHRAEVYARAGQFVESTDWVSFGFQNYGHWLATRLDKPMTPRESAYIDQMLSAPRNSPFVRKRHRQAWRGYIADLGRDHGRYAFEVTDPRIVVHLEEILPSPASGIEGLNEDPNMLQGLTLQQKRSVELFKSLQQMEGDVLEVHTDGSFHEKDGEPSQSGGGILIKTEPNEIREVCYMGSMMHDPSEAEMGAIYRGLQILRETLRSKDVPRYRRVLIATDSIQVLEALCGYSVWYTELRKMTRIAALCRMETYDIVKENSDIERIDFVWLPRQTGGNVDADQLARAGRLSAFNFLNDDRGSTSSGSKKRRTATG